MTYEERVRAALDDEIVAAMRWGERENGGPAWNVAHLAACMEARAQIDTPRLSTLRRRLAVLAGNGRVERLENGWRCAPEVWLRDV